ncbi:MAG: 50S ribosomal protein L3 [Gammaproteobacteria bacterium]|nr:50S ribosomal protein L3 [Gammaproteobacteria bacterium]
MAIGLVGRKLGMTRVFTENGASTPVTVVSVELNRITQIKTLENDGYYALQVATGERRASRVTKPMAGHYSKAGVAAGRGLWEFRIDESEVSDFEVGGSLDATQFEVGQKIDVIGTTIGKGFAGTIKRHNFAMGDATHGNSLSHRSAGAIGQCQTPGRVFKGKKMAGHMGNVRRTIQNLEIVKVDVDRNFILVKGAVPGAKNGDLFIQPAVKAKK